MPLLTDGITEVVATTRKNAAPIGIISRGGKLRMVLFRGSHTAENVERDGWVVANFTFDPVVIVMTAFADLPDEAFTEETIDGIRMDRLAVSEGWAAFRAVVLRKTGESLLVELTLLREERGGARLRPINRGFNSLVEATVHGTRYALRKDPVLGDLIEHHAGIVRKCGGPREQEALAMLLEYCGYP